MNEKCDEVPYRSLPIGLSAAAEEKTETKEALKE